MNDYKPGDVGSIPFGCRDEIGLYTDEGWVTPHAVRYPNKDYTDVRPLVVIDPDDAEQIERLDALIVQRMKDNPLGRRIPDLAAALREFASPTPPNCGAVLNIAGVPYPCEGPAGHACAHGNDAARAIWRES